MSRRCFAIFILSVLLMGSLSASESNITITKPDNSKYYVYRVENIDTNIFEKSRYFEVDLQKRSNTSVDLLL